MRSWRAQRTFLLSAARRAAFTSLITAIASSGAGCQAVSSSEQSDPVVGGRAEAGFAAQGRLEINKGAGWQGNCGAELIAPRVVLTAAHCVIGEDASQFRLLLGGNTYNVVDWRYHKDFRSPPAANNWRYDLAVMVLEAPGVAGVGAVRIDDVAANSTNRAVGFGRTTYGPSGTPGGWGHAKKSVLYRTDTIGELAFAAHGVADGVANPVGGLCWGDSGSGDWVDDVGQRKLVGLLADFDARRVGGAFSCQDGNAMLFTRLKPYDTAAADGSTRIQKMTAAASSASCERCLDVFGAGDGAGWCTRTAAFPGGRCFAADAFTGDKNDYGEACTGTFISIYDGCPGAVAPEPSAAAVAGARLARANVESGSSGSCFDPETHREPTDEGSAESTSSGNDSLFQSFLDREGSYDVCRPEYEHWLCEHDACEPGSAMDGDCDSCAYTVCSFDPICCNLEWDATCVSEAQASCGCSTCGNGLCDPGEDCTTCPGDCGSCGPVCGNGLCESGEDCTTCPGDCGSCGPVCGDGFCEPGEDCTTCPIDCGSCGPACGNGLCEPGEDCTTCSIDCGLCEPSCGNGLCEPGEDCMSCSIDCGLCPPSCGNGLCEPGEDCTSCSIDCGLCEPSCGNGLCEPGEDCMSCSIDCGLCPPSCGNGLCEPGEGCTTCSIDCGFCEPSCGNGLCEPGEDCTSCSIDCGLCNPDCTVICSPGQPCKCTRTVTQTVAPRGPARAAR